MKLVILGILSPIWMTAIVLGFAIAALVASIFVSGAFIKLAFDYVARGYE